jgi:serine protease inhibitor
MRWPFGSESASTVDLPQQIASPSRRFAFKLLRGLEPEQPSGNIFFSPASVMLCLWLLEEGATGETREAINQALEIAGLEPDALGLARAAVKSALQIAAPGLQLESANALWCNQSFRPRAEYTARIKEEYGAEVKELDFRSPRAVPTINAWVSTKTHDRIQDTVRQIDPLTALVAVNALYFKDFWSKQFEPGLTREEPFHRADGRKLTRPLMGQSGSYFYYEESSFQAVRLPYKTSRLGMYVFLPAKGSSLRKFREKLGSAAWEEWMGRFTWTEGHIRLPRFKLTYRTELTGALEKLGMGIAFDRARARFDGISVPPPEIWLGQVLHQAFVEVNEAGTEAAAVTRVGVTMAAARVPTRPPRRFQMIVDRPFFFAISDSETNTVLFMGCVEEPTGAG